ncbi:MAG: hypothetical protein U0166_03935 [Acidobacteriota bacterium]
MRDRRGELVRLLAALLSLVALACRAGSVGPADPLESSARVRTLEAQLAAVPGYTAEWREWFAQLSRLNVRSQPTEPLFLQAETERPLYDDDLLRRLMEPSPPGTPVSGPIPTILDVSRQLRARGIDLLVVPVPPRSAVYPELFVPDHAPVAPGELPPLLDYRLRQLYLRLEKEGVEVLDLLPTFLVHRYEYAPGTRRRTPRYAQLLYMRQDPHWSAYATDLAASVLARRIARYPWFPDVVTRFGRAHVETSVTPVKAPGFTAQELIKAGRLDAGYPPDRFFFFHARIAGERWSHDDATSPILLMGDSFAMPYWGLPDQLLARLRMRVDLVAVAGGVQSSQLRAVQLRNGLDGKRLVVWEICAHSLINISQWTPTDLGPTEVAPPPHDETGAALR